ncbi:hypothetical protein CYY_007746 [Polysphondylium violaceum]|uniref:Plectin/eS10 N-terminal domain-containing protein n=1 Tax=Polysphondylium violaceum TaxID=133409 RepID=A0A8J4PQG8_9MYCE|nr:hypothetical protein CYY_007746 [Polysphondylium violaceum]
MIIPKENRLAIYRYLFQEGVLVAKKDFKLEKHPNIESVSNLEVLATLKSFKSKKFVTESFNWQYYYWVLTDEGVKYLSQYLQLPESVVPATHKKQATRATTYGRPHGDEKRTGPSGEFDPSFNRDRRGPRPQGARTYRRDTREERPAAPAATQQ